jgi:hypothetical protein
MSTGKRYVLLILIPAPGLLALVGTLTLLAAWGNGSPVAHAQAGVQRVAGVTCYVAPTGSDEIRVATGTYTGLHGHAVPADHPYPLAGGVSDTCVITVTTMPPVTGEATRARAAH